MPNRLASETSPYLLQHKDNPVDWYPWGDEAIEAAQRRQVPILLSIGYSSCHWCHVMERESFEDPGTAGYMNEHFVPIKVDREERPDIDSTYMQAVQTMTGHGGWPMTVFLDTSLRPFYGGTYFPPSPSQAMPSFRQVMEGVVDAWNNRRDELEGGAEKLTQKLAAAARLKAGNNLIEATSLSHAEAVLDSSFDRLNGGFSGAPKFPPASALEFLIRRNLDGGERPAEMATKTLTAMASGGIYDHVGGGFARYSVDEKWLVPHFEKMLYDNAQLARVYLHAWQVNRDPLYRQVCEQTLEWSLAEMRGPEGGFYSAIDADSESVEGKFYLWTYDKLVDLLGEGSPLINYWGVTPQGNFEGENILTVANPGAATAEQVTAARATLYETRAKRTWPDIDDKRITSWNALMVAALADAGAVLDRNDFTDAAKGCADFLLKELRKQDGRLLRAYRNGAATIDAFLEDYAFTVEALLTLYEATFIDKYFVAAKELAEIAISDFHDPEGGFYSVPSNQAHTLFKSKEIEDHPIPSGNSSIAMGLLRLHAFTGEGRYEKIALSALGLAQEAHSRFPQAFAYALCATDFYLAESSEVALVGPELESFISTYRAKYRPNCVIAASPDPLESPVPLLKDRAAIDLKPTAYVCHGIACDAPTTNLTVFKSAIGG